MAPILIIDDDEGIRLFLDRVFSVEGHSTYMAADGKEACVIAAEAQPDIVIADLWMPKREGLETIRLIRDVAPQAIIIAISGRPVLANVSLFKIAKAEGATAALLKPFTREEIVKLVDELLVG